MDYLIALMRFYWIRKPSHFYLVKPSHLEILDTVLIAHKLQRTIQKIQYIRLQIIYYENYYTG